MRCVVTQRLTTNRLSRCCATLPSMSVMYSPTTWSAPKVLPGQTPKLLPDQASIQEDPQRLTTDLLRAPEMASPANCVVGVDMTEHERKVVGEFVHYLEKSKHLFNGLR